MRRIAVLTSGGDSPGRNACIRAVVRTGIYYGLKVFGIKRGYKGLIQGELIPMEPKSVGGIISLGGTILLSARCEEFKTKEGLKRACLTLKNNNIDGLIIIGGNGSFAGAYSLSKYTDTAIIGIPASIDNDIGGTDYSIGFDTAVNTALSAIDKIRDTATSHERLFFVEVMGRNAGFIAMACGIAGGAEEILLPEVRTDLKALCRRLDEGKQMGKLSSIVVVAEGDESGGAFKVAEKIKKMSPDYEVRVSVIGHQQRGGTPSAWDRIMAARFGKSAVDALLKGKRSKIVGYKADKVVLVRLKKTFKERRKIDPSLIELYKILAI